MLSVGSCRYKKENFAVKLNHTKKLSELILIKDGNIESAYKTDGMSEFSYKSSKAREIYKVIQKGLKGCTAKNGVPMPSDVGAMQKHEFIRSKVTFNIYLHINEVCGIIIEGDDISLNVSYSNDIKWVDNIPYVKLTSVATKIEGNEEDDLSRIPVRTVEEIAIEKEDITWLEKKKYYVVQDEETAEQLFNFLDGYKKAIAYDIESTGLKMNMFGKIGSKYMADLEKYNEEHPDEKVRADRLCGIIFCVEPDVSYYFPCFSRKYKVLYQDKDNAHRIRIINNTKARYTIGDKREEDGDMARYIRETPADEIRDDVVLMERVRDILEKGNIVTHGGSIEYKTGLMYDIDTNIVDDTMIMHQLLYKFNGNFGKHGEKSNLKYLSKTYLGIDQWSLKDFFPSVKDEETDSGKTREKKTKKGSNIDFSYMDLQGTHVYAPTDGDCTLLLFYKFKKDMIENYNNQLYIYGVEILVLLCIGYMEFYGHRIDERKINGAKVATMVKMVGCEHSIRESIEYNGGKENEIYTRVMNLWGEKEQKEEELNKKYPKGIPNEEYVVVEDKNKEIEEEIDNLNKEIANDTEHNLNLGSPKQMAELFYDQLGLPVVGEKKSMDEKTRKKLLKGADLEDKRYATLEKYSEYIKENTLLTKFFGNLPDFMYPGGFIFSSYGQIGAATGRMTCSKPNAQQYPKVIAKIVIPREGNIMVDSDYAQIELRIIIALSGNPYLLSLAKDPDGDLHTIIAAMMYGVPYEQVTDKMRSDAKAFNFGIPFGMGIKSLAILLSGKTTEEAIEEAKEKYDLYFERQPETKRMFENIKEYAQVYGYTETVWHRRRSYTFMDENGDIDKSKRARALRQAGNARIQGTAADIFKISVARNFNYIRKNKLFGKFLIINMIHDEQLMEIDVQHLNALRVLSDIGRAMQFELDGFPPLYIGAGVGRAWGTAKGKGAEIHPNLMEQYHKEAENLPIFRDDTSWNDPEEVIQYFEGRLVEFRSNKVKEYIENEENWHKIIHPVIAKLINSDFNFGRGTAEKAGMGDVEFLNANLDDFCKWKGLEINSSYFETEIKATQEDEEEEDGYSDNPEDFEAISDYEESEFQVLDESDVVYGASVGDLIGQFGTCVIKHKKICGIDVREMRGGRLDIMCSYLEKHCCDENDDGALKVVFLKVGNIVKNTGIYVKDLNAEELEEMYENSRKAVNHGDIENRRVK